nr:rhodanese-like domain-containing protein [Tanacetum cinerariifolium]
MRPEDIVSASNGKKLSLMHQIYYVTLWGFKSKRRVPEGKTTATKNTLELELKSIFVSVDNNVNTLLRGGKDLDDALVSVVIRNLKVVQLYGCSTSLAEDRVCNCYMRLKIVLVVLGSGCGKSVE